MYPPPPPLLPSPPSTFRVSDQFNNHIITKIGGGNGIIDNGDVQVRTTEYIVLLLTILIRIFHFLVIRERQKAT